MMKDYRGGGIGLSISNQLVKLMGGELKLETKENEGSTFYFSLQLKKTLSLKADVLKIKPVFESKFRVLVAEDNITNQKVIKFLLEGQGADCTFVKNGVEALELYKILDFDMVFMDIYMPDMDGYEATKYIKQTKKYANYNTPIIAVSASAFEQDIENAKQAGIDDFLAKPIEVAKLKALLIKYSKTRATA
jgi:CheY-like chemotaxis protein